MAATAWDEKFNKLSEFELERMSFYAGEKYAELEEEGEYKCARCANNIYSSADKFIATPPLNEFPTFRASVADGISTKRVYSFGMKRTEVQCANCSLHLGYVFLDGKESGDIHDNAGERHCLLSLCLDFIPKDQANIDLPEFDCPPTKVFDHLQQQDQTARELIDSGSSIELKAKKNEPEQSEQPKPATDTPTLQRQDTPQVPITKDVSPQEKTPKSEAKAAKEAKSVSSQTPPARVSAPSPSTTRGMPQQSTRPDAPTFSSETRKPPQPSESGGNAVIIAPIVLAIVGSVVLYFAYKASQEKK